MNPLAEWFELLIRAFRWAQIMLIIAAVFVILAVAGIVGLVIYLLW